ncbi:MAG TPA: porin family protein [Puia sp.]|nr:porin family protein [Puia sp.]
MKTKVKTIISYCLLFAVLTCIAFGAQAQEQQTSMENNLRPKLGIKGGLNLTNLYVDDASDEHMKAGFNAGLFAKFPITRGFSIQPELLYSEKGARDDYDNIVQGSGSYRFNLGYIELPLLAVVNLAPNFNIHAGGYAAYLVSANVKDIDNNGDVHGATDLDADNFNRWDFGLVGGLGFDIENFTIGARYNYGLQHIGKSGSLSGDLTEHSKNAGVSIYVGFGF